MLPGARCAVVLDWPGGGDGGDGRETSQCRRAEEECPDDAGSQCRSPVTWHKQREIGNRVPGIVEGE